MTHDNRLKQRILNSKTAGKICAAFGIDPKQYRLLVALFDTLSDRLEFLSVRIDLGRLAGYCLVLSLLFSIAAFFRPPLPAYRLIFVGISMVLFLMVILQDVSHSLLNADEATVLAHQPIRGATYTAAKLTHLLKLIAVMALSLNLVPAFAGLFLRETRWYYPLSHLAAAFLEGVFVAFAVCGFLGWLFRLVSPERLKSAVLWLQMIFFLAFTFAGNPLLLRLWVSDARMDSILERTFSLPWMPWQWFVTLGLLGHGGYGADGIWESLAACFFTAVLVVFGIRAFRADYMIKASSLRQGVASPARFSSRRTVMGKLVRKVAGASGHAAFSFLGILCRRDWVFRQQVLMYPAILLIMGFSAALFGIRTPPFWSPGEGTMRFSLIHLLPHVLGVFFMFAASALPYTAEPQGAAVFISHPVRNFRAFVGGLYLLPWICLVGLPHLCLLFPCAWSWGVLPAALFLVFSMLLATVYLAWAFFFVSGFPFVNPFKPSRAGELQLFIFPAMVVAAVLTGVQWLVFYSPVFVSGAILFLLVINSILLPVSMRRMQTRARRNLELLNLTPQGIFKETD